MAGETIIIENDVPVADDAAEPVIEPKSAEAPGKVILDALQTAQDPRKALLSAFTAGNENAPQIDMLMKLLGGGGESDDEARREEMRAEVRAEQEVAVAELGETAKRLFAEREECRARIEVLAAAIGACPACFGENLLCETCHGAGRPGARTPTAPEFRTYILPAVERVRAAIRRDPYRRPWPRSSTGSPGINGPQPLTTSGGLS